MYALRRGFATNTGKNLDPKHAKFLMGHQANSTMMERQYDQTVHGLNLTEGLLGPDEAQIPIAQPLSFRRSVFGFCFPMAQASRC